MEWRRLLLALFVSVSHASHEWSSGDEARSAAQAARLEIGARSLAESFSHHATLLRRHLLEGYDRSVPPPSNRTSSNYSQAGVDVAMNLRFFKIESVMAADGRMALKVWLRLSWTDRRLAWEPSEWGGLTQLHFMGASLPAGAEVTEIWLPDVQPYNSFTGIHNTLDPSVAIVQSDGSVFFSRPGMLDVMCKFSGLAAFPYDRLRCGVEFGGWGYSGLYQGLELQGDGYSFSKQESTSGASYQEYSIGTIEASIQENFYPCCPSEPWPVIKYIVTLDRASYYYTLSFVMPGILITMLSFAVYYARSDACDALAYSVTVVLANEISQLALAGAIPVCGEALWTEIFSLTNTVFCVFALFESVLQVIVSNTTTSLIPGWMTALLAPIFLIGRNKKVDGNKDAISPHRSSSLRRARQAASKNTIPRTSRNSGGGSDRGSDTSTSEAPATSDQAPMRDVARFNKFRSVARSLACKLPQDGKLPQPAKESRIDGIEKLVFFEHLFFVMDENAEGIIPVERIKERISFLALEHEESEIDSKLEKADRDHNGQLTRLEFCELCADCLMSYPIVLLRLANDNFVLADTQDKRGTAAYWKAIGNKMDWWCGAVLPWTYLIILAVLFNLTMTDDYNDPEVEMYEGMGPSSLRGLFKYQVGPVHATFRALAPAIVGFALLVASVTFCYAKREKINRNRETASYSHAKVHVQTTESAD